MDRRIVYVALAALLAVPAPASAAPTMQTAIEWTSGHFEAGLSGVGQAVFPEDLPAPDHERIDFEASPCHRDLMLDIFWRPDSANATVEEVGSFELPYRFRATVFASNGSIVDRRVIENPQRSFPLAQVPDAGEYTLELELLEGADVEWDLRVRAFGTFREATCDLWLNEVELAPSELGDEFVEIYNDGPAPVTLAGYELRTREDTHALAPLQLAPGERRAIGLPADTLADTNETVQLAPENGAWLDRTPTLTDEAADGQTWQRAGDAPGPWTLLDGTPGAPNAG